MKNSIVLLLIFIFSSLVMSGCITSDFSQNQLPKIENQEIQNTRMETITGKIEILPNGAPALIAKWESKSRISYTIVGDMSKEFYQRDGEILTVDCIIIAIDSPWRGEMVIISVHP